MDDLKTVFQLSEKALMLRALKHFEPISGESGINVIPNKGMIACTARSGSSLLSACLERYDLRFYEYLNSGGYVNNAVQEHGVQSFSDMGNHLAQHAVSKGRFSLKVAYEDLPMLLYLNEMPRRADEWRVVFLQRRNFVRQAISMLIASKSGQWTFDMASRAEVTDSDYSFSDVMRYVEYISATNAKWERFFSLFDVRPCRITYENLVADMAAETERVGVFLGIDVAAYPDAKNHKPRLESQTSDLNRRWEQRFRDELGQAAMRAAEGEDDGFLRGVAGE